MRKILLIFMVAAAALALRAQEQLTNLPTIYIATEGGAEVNDKENYVPGTATIVTDNEADAIEGKAIGIRGRGNSTWSMPKKPFRIKFDKKINLFNLPAKAKSWVLLANYADKTLMRNALAFEISRYLSMPFSPSTVFADVVLNGEYLGNYLVTDQMEVNAGRVNIDEMDETCLEGDELTGGYFLEIDGFGASEPVHFVTPKGMTITVKSPKEEVIQPAQLQYITSFINQLEAKLFSSNFTDPEAGYRSMVDERTLVDWYIACELTGNSDSFWSTYIYKPRGEERIYFGPLWDFDIAFNNDNRLGDAQYRLMRDAAHDPKTWISRLWQDQWFRTAVYNRWKQLVSSGMEQHLLQYIDDTAQMLDASQQRNFQRWRILSQQVYLETFLFRTYAEGVEYLKTYVSNRISFLSDSFKASGEASVIDGIKDGQAYYIRHYNGLYATPEEANFYIENMDLNRQKLTFASAGDGLWNIRTYDDRLVASKGAGGDKYCMYLDPSQGSDPRAQFAVEASQHTGYAKIKNMATGLYLGIENQAHMSRISTNKSGTETNHAWKIFDAGVNTTALEKQIAAAQEMLQNAVAGTEPGNYPQQACDELAAAISEARAHLGDEDQASVDAAAEALRQAVKEFRAQRILSDQVLEVAADMQVADPDALAIGTCYNITSPEALLVFENVKPLDVLEHADQILVNGAPMEIDETARISVYKQGSALLAHGQDYAPFTAYAQSGCQGLSMECLPELYYSNSPSAYVKAENKRPMPLKDQVKSFVLKRGYMATLAQEENGMGYSQVFIADKEDMRAEVPAEFAGKVGFIRVLPWQWTSKKGWVGGNSNPDNPEGFLEDQCDVTNSTWVYSWGPNADWARRPVVRGTPWRNQEFVPQKWGYGGDSDWTTIYNQRGSNHLLGYNEPDHSEQANVSVDKAIEEWPKLLQTGMRLGTPSTTDFWWLYDFLDKAKAKGYRVDFVAIHAYWGGQGGSVVVNDIDDWMQKLTEIHERTGLPIWITEWNNGANWTHETWPATEAEQQEKQRAFIAEILRRFDAEPWMERYSIYNWVEAKRSMFHGNLDLTPAGQEYAGFNADFAYQTFAGDPGSVSDPSGAAALRYDPLALRIIASEPCDIAVYSADGRAALRAKGASSLSVASLAPGIYLATANGQSIKFLR